MLAVAVLGASTLLGPVAHGAEASVTFSATLPLRTTSWNDTVVLPRFDPALGELRSVAVSVDAHLEGTIAIENLAPASATLAATLSALVTVSRPASGGTIGTSQPSNTRSVDLGAFDGTIDHSGASGHTQALQADLDTTATLTAAPDLTLFTGTSPIALPTSGTGTSVGPSGAGVDVQLTTRVGAAVTVTYTYVSDTRPPDPPTILSGPPAFTPDPDPVVTFTAEAGTTTECRLQTPTAPGTWSPCSSPWEAHLGPEGDGAHTFSVRAIDGSGNVGEPAARSFTLDQVPPAQPTLTFTPPALGQSPNPAWAFTVETGATARCRLDGSAPLPCTSPFTADLVLAPDGPHTFAVHAVDAAGNVGPAISHTYTLDRVAPAAPSITLSPPSPGNDPTPTWSFVEAADAVSASCSVDGGGYAACGSPFTANLASAADGTHTLAVRNADGATNQSAPVTATYELDRAAPGAPTITSPPSPSNDASPVWTIVAEEGSTTRCSLDDGAWTACDGTFSTTFGPGSDGIHILAVAATDAAGNEGPEAIAVYALDTTAPAAPVIASAPADPSNSPTPSWTFTFEAGSQASCSLDGAAWAPCGSPHTVDLTAAGDGVHELAVRATDAQGNTGPAAISRFTLDRTAPGAPSFTVTPASPGSVATVRWDFTTPAGTTTTCRIDLGPILPCVDHVEVTLDEDGTHRLAVVAHDQAGNPSAPAEATYTLDRVAPAPPTITTSPTSPARSTTPQWSFTVEVHSDGECSMNGAAWVPCQTSFSADLSGAPDGPHTFAVRSVDAAGNVGAATVGVFVLDRTPPGAARLTSGPEPHSQDSTPTWTFEIDADASAECRIDDGPWQPCDGSVTADLTEAADGTHALEVRVTDAVGNEGPLTVTAYALDRIAPDAATFTSGPLTPGSSPTPEWAFSHEPGAAAWCSIGTLPPTPCDGVFAAELVDDGIHELLVVVIDAAGNISLPAVGFYELDTIAPVAPTVVAPRTPGRDHHPVWTIELEPGAVAECSFDGGPQEPCGTVFMIDLAGRDGAHRLVVTARDAAGNASIPVSSTYVLDTRPPAAPAMVHTPDRSSWNWRFTVESGATAECSIDGGPWAPCTSPRAGGSPDKTVRFEVRAVDRAGNRSSITSITVTPTLGTAVAAPFPPAPVDHRVPPGVGAFRPRLPGAAAAVAGLPLPVVPPPAGPARELADDLEVGSDVLRGDFRRATDPVLGPVRELLQAAAKTSTIPVVLILLVLGFVAVQNQIDRRDPKLADAPVRHEPEYVEFK